jgi:hypothetical protein
MGSLSIDRSSWVPGFMVCRACVVFRKSEYFFARFDTVRPHTGECTMSAEFDKWLEDQKAKPLTIQESKAPRVTHNRVGFVRSNIRGMR